MRRATVLAVLGALTAAWVVLAPAGAGAAPAAHANRVADDHQRTLDYWTKSRMEEAAPRGKGRSVVKGRIWKDQDASVARTTGKVFFLMGGRPYVCSASAIGNADAVDLVLTAGHCVYDHESGDYASFFLFIPGYAGGGWAGYDVWTAEAVFATDGWRDGDLADDAGLAVMTSGEGGPTLREALGTLPTMVTDHDYSSADGQVFSAFGYPSVNPYKGVRLGWCQGPVEVGGVVPDTLSLPCRMTGGASGGPWYAGPEGRGHIASLNSFGFDGVKEMFGPTFDAAEERMLAEAADGGCSESELCTTGLTSDPTP